MKIIVTDTGEIWNHQNPFLKPYKNAVFVVCLNGEKVTDEYECFVPADYEVDKGKDKKKITANKYAALQSAADAFSGSLGYHDDIVILADGNPETLYPFAVLKNRKSNRLHLCTMSPWRFANREKIELHRQLLTDLNGLASFLYLDSDRILDKEGQRADYEALQDEAKRKYGEILPRILNQIHEMKSLYPYFFDWTTLTYLSTQEKFDRYKIPDLITIEDKINFEMKMSFCTLGMAWRPDYPEDKDQTRQKIEQIIPRPDGKKICNILRKKRMELAKINRIPFRSAECPLNGPCAGTCPKCDEEADYLRKALEKIPPKKRKYPVLDVKKEMQ